jgi:hypothetical protein
MGTVVHLSDRAGSQARGGCRRGGQVENSHHAPMADALQTCADLIASTIDGRIRELGGTDLDIRHLATSAAYAVFVSTAGSLR